MSLICTNTVYESPSCLTTLCCLLLARNCSSNTLKVSPSKYRSHRGQLKKSVSGLIHGGCYKKWTIWDLIHKKKCGALTKLSTCVFRHSTKVQHAFWFGWNGQYINSPMLSNQQAVGECCLGNKLLGHPSLIHHDSMVRMEMASSTLISQGVTRRQPCGTVAVVISHLTHGRVHSYWEKLLGVYPLVPRNRPSTSHCWKGCLKV